MEFFRAQVEELDVLVRDLGGELLQVADVNELRIVAQPDGDCLGCGEQRLDTLLLGEIGRVGQTDQECNVVASISGSSVGSRSNRELRSGTSSP